MKNNVIIFPMYVKHTNKKYYAIMYNALHSLYETGFKDEFDIFVCYYNTGYDIKSYKHFDGTEDIFKDFPKINFIYFPFDIFISSDILFFKWKFIDYFFSSYSYEKIFILDADMIFYQNPNYIFDKYDEDDVAYVLFENTNPFIKEIVGGNGINGGQIIINQKIYQNNIKNLYSKMTLERSRLLEKAKNICLSKEDYEYFDGLSDQYCLLNVLNNSNVNIKSLDVKDICYGRYACDIIKDESEKIKVIPHTNILHYYSANDYLFLLDKFKTKEMREKLAIKIKEEPINY